EATPPPPPDPNEEPISMQEAQEIWDLAKKNGRVVPLGGGKFDVSTYKAALVEVGKAESSTKILRKNLKAMKEWVSVPASSPPAASPAPESKPEANMDSEPEVEQ